jgi:TetR/AcrR family fatty acid metabolism transcriptional regulator
MSPLIVDKAEKKRKILDAALGVFVDKGFSNVVINDIARSAGIGKGTVYEYFKSKEELFSELLKYLFARYQSYVPKEWKKGTTPAERLKNLLSFYTRLYVQASSRRNKVIFMLVDYLSHNSAESSRKREGYFSGYREEIRSIIEEGIKLGTFRKVDVESAVTSITIAIDGLMFQMLLMPASINVKKTSQSLIDMILTYLKAKEV